MEPSDPPKQTIRRPECCLRRRLARPSARWALAVSGACCAVCVCTPAQAQDAGSPTSPAPGVRSPEPTIKPPDVEKRVDALYPPEALAARREASVVLQLTIDAAGAVVDVAVIDSGGGDFDRAAASAARAWRFRPAMRGDRPMASRIKVPFRFALPHE